MANSKKGRRRFGNVRNLPSGRWQARYLGPDQVERKAPHTFETERQAESWLTIVEGEIIKGEWSAPDAGNEELGEYGERWIAERKLAPRTRELYEDLFRLWIRPHLGHLTSRLRPLPHPGAGRCPPSTRCTAWPTCPRTGSARWSSSLRCPGCAGVSWRRYAGPTWTWSRASSGYPQARGVAAPDGVRSAEVGGGQTGRGPCRGRPSRRCARMCWSSSAPTRTRWCSSATSAACSVPATSGAR